MHSIGLFMRLFFSVIKSSIYFNSWHHMYTFLFNSWYHMCIFLFNSWYHMYIFLTETHLTEMATMGIGNKPSLDLKPSADNIQDRFINVTSGNFQGLYIFASSSKNQLLFLEAWLFYKQILFKIDFKILWIWFLYKYLLLNLLHGCPMQNSNFRTFAYINTK